MFYSRLEPFPTHHHFPDTVWLQWFLSAITLFTSRLESASIHHHSAWKPSACNKHLVFFTFQSSNSSNLSPISIRVNVSCLSSSLQANGILIMSRQRNRAMASVSDKHTLLCRTLFSFTEAAVSFPIPAGFHGLQCSRNMSWSENFGMLLASSSLKTYATQTDWI